jgi:hypothetical protein
MKTGLFKSEFWKETESPQSMALTLADPPPANPVCITSWWNHVRNRTRGKVGSQRTGTGQSYFFFNNNSFSPELILSEVSICLLQGHSLYTCLPSSRSPSFKGSITSAPPHWGPSFHHVNPRDTHTTTKPWCVSFKNICPTLYFLAYVN